MEKRAWQYGFPQADVTTLVVFLIWKAMAAYKCCALLTLDDSNVFYYIDTKHPEDIEIYGSEIIHVIKSWLRTEKLNLVDEKEEALQEKAEKVILGSTIPTRKWKTSSLEGTAGSKIH